MFKIPEHIRARSAARQAVATRMFALDDLTLARQLLGLARMVRTHLRDAGDEWIDRHDSPVYHNTLLWTAIPDLAFRLGLQGKRVYLPHERSRADITSIDDGRAYRTMITSMMRNACLGTRIKDREDDPTPSAEDILSALPVHGNPIAFALERIYPAAAFADDTKYHGEYLDLGHTLRAHGLTNMYWIPAAA